MKSSSERHDTPTRTVGQRDHLHPMQPSADPFKAPHDDASRPGHLSKCDPGCGTSPRSRSATCTTEPGRTTLDRDRPGAGSIGGAPPDPELLKLLRAAVARFRQVEGPAQAEFDVDGVRVRFDENFLIGHAVSA